jgi:hypothetical protein
MDATTASTLAGMINGICMLVERLWFEMATDDRYSDPPLKYAFESFLEGVSLTGDFM